MMRAFICTDFESEFRRLVWLTEFKSGVSVGLYNGKSDPHATYHTDGTFQHKITTSRGVVCIQDSKKKPALVEITQKEQLLNTSVEYNDVIMSRHTIFKPDHRTRAVVFLPHALFLGTNAIALNSSIINCKYEEDYIQHAYDDFYQDKSFKLVAVYVLALDLFTNHKVGLIIYTGKRIEH